MTRIRESTRDHHAQRRDRGVTFIEILVTITLLGTVVIAVLAAAQASVRASRVSREASRVESALLTAAERIERAPRSDAAYRCDLSGPVYAAAQLKLGVSQAEAPLYATVTYQHLTAGGWVDGACPGGSYQANLVQRITITMTSPNNGLERTLDVLKGDT